MEENRYGSEIISTTLGFSLSYKAKSEGEKKQKTESQRENTLIWSQLAARPDLSSYNTIQSV